MRNMKSNQSGFSTIFILVLVIPAIIGAVGYVVYARSKANKVIELVYGDTNSSTKTNHSPNKADRPGQYKDSMISFSFPERFVLKPGSEEGKLNISDAIGNILLEYKTMSNDELADIQKGIDYRAKKGNDQPDSKMYSLGTRTIERTLVGSDDGKYVTYEFLDGAYYVYIAYTSSEVSADLDMIDEIIKSITLK